MKGATIFKTIALVIGIVLIGAAVVLGFGIYDVKTAEVRHTAN